MKNKLKKEVNIWNKFGLGIFLAIAYSPLLLSLLKSDDYKLKKEVEFKNITVEDMCNSINNSTNLNEEEKEYLINEDLYEDIVNCINQNQKENNILNVLNEYDIIPMSDEVKNELFLTAGYYLRETEPNHIYVRDYKEKVEPYLKNTISHEHIHSLQCDNKYKYVFEPATAIINDEYYCSDNSYPEEKKRVKVLMEIIGPKPIWDLCFLGDSSEIENIFYQYLERKDAKKLIKLFKDINNPQNKEIDELLKKLYFNIHGKHILSDDVILSIYNNWVGSRKYFNITDEYDIIYQPISHQKVQREGLLKEKYEFFKPYEIAKEDFSIDLFRGNIRVREKYESEYSFRFVDDNKIMIEIESGNWKEYDIEKAKEIGYLKVIYAVEESIITESESEKNKLYQEGYYLKNIQYLYDEEKYHLIKYSIVMTLGTEKEIPTIKEKFETSNVKKLVKE